MDPSFWDGKRVLVTGASGFVGRWAVRSLATTGAHLVVTDREAPELDRLLIEDPSADITCAPLDLCDREQTRNALMALRPEVVVHLAGTTDEKPLPDNPATAFDANVGATVSLLEASRAQLEDRPGSLRAVVVASSNRVYGEQRSEPTNESAPLNGRDTFAATKLCADVLTQTYAFEHGVPATIARLTTSYGGDDPNSTRLVPTAIRSVLKGERPVIYGTGQDTRAFVHIDDTVDGVLHLAERTALDPALAGLAFNLVHDEPMSVLAIVKLIAETAGRPDLEPDVLHEREDIQHEHLDNTLARGLLRWRPRYSIAEGVEEALTWYRSRSAAA